MKLVLRLCAAALALHLAMSASAQSTVQLRRDGDQVDVSALAVVDADLRTVWSTLVDYDRLPDFIPDLLASRTVSRSGGDAVVEQSGEAGLGPFKFHLALTMSVQEVPMSSISAQAVSGDFVRFTAVYKVHAMPGGRTGLDYQATIEPRGGIPPLIGMAVMHLEIRRQFNALLAEIERRGRVDNHVRFRSSPATG